jgi:hypothetical protein
MRARLPGLPASRQGLIAISAISSPPGSFRRSMDAQRPQFGTRARIAADADVDVQEDSLLPH